MVITLFTVCSYVVHQCVYFVHSLFIMSQTWFDNLVITVQKDQEMVKCSEICSESVQKAKILNSFRTLSEQGLYAYREKHCSETVQKNVFMNTCMNTFVFINVQKLFIKCFRTCYNMKLVLI